VPIKGVSGKVRTPRTGKIRLGYTVPGQNRELPKDTDTFVAKKSDGITDAILQAYDAKAITGAAGKGDEAPYSLGKELRMILPWEYNATAGDREISLELLNRNWAHSKGLLCSGNGGEDELGEVLPGDAIVRNEAAAKLIGAATKKPAQLVGEGRWAVECRGPQCPLWHDKYDKTRNPMGGCHRQMRLQAILLHPTRDPESPDYLRQMGWIEVASGSFNGMVDVNSGFAMIHSLIGRTAWIPFALRRVARVMTTEGKRVVKHTLMVDYDADEVVRSGLLGPARIMVRPAVLREYLQLAQAEAGFDSVRDILPRPETLALPEGRPEKKAPTNGAEWTPPEATTAGDRDQEVENATNGHDGGDSDNHSAAEQISEEELNRFLTTAERDDLKVLCGATPGDRETMEPFREKLRLAFRALDNWEPSDGRTTPAFDEIQVRHALYIREKVEEEQAAEVELRDPDEVIPPPRRRVASS